MFGFAHCFVLAIVWFSGYWLLVIGLVAYLAFSASVSKMDPGCLDRLYRYSFGLYIGINRVYLSLSLSSSLGSLSHSR